MSETNIVTITFAPIFQAILQTIFQILKVISERYDLDYDEMVKMFCFDTASIKKAAKKATKELEKQQKKEEKQVEKAKYPIPFCPEHIDNTKCQSLIKNNGLFTQCGRKASQNGYCSICSNNPENTYEKFGTVKARLDAAKNKKIGLYGYKTPLGESPIPYLNLLKSDVTPDMVREELQRFDIINIPNEHFTQTSTIERKPTKKTKSNTIPLPPNVEPPSTPPPSTPSTTTEPPKPKRTSTKKNKVEVAPIIEPPEPTPVVPIVEPPKTTKRTTKTTTTATTTIKLPKNIKDKYKPFVLNGTEYLMSPDDPESLYSYDGKTLVQAAYKDEHNNWELF